MLRKKKDADVINTVIGSEITIEAAKIIGNGSIRIDGKFHGNIELDGGLNIGETGYVSGNIWVKDIFIAGCVKGDLHCEGKAHLSSTARVYGGVETGCIVMDEGVIFNGKCRTLRTEAIQTGDAEEDDRNEAIGFYPEASNA